MCFPKNLTDILRTLTFLKIQIATSDKMSEAAFGDIFQNRWSHGLLNM